MTPISIRMVVLANPLMASFGVTSPVSTRTVIVSMMVRLTGIFSIRNEIIARTRIMIVSVAGVIFYPLLFI